MVLVRCLYSSSYTKFKPKTNRCQEINEEIVTKWYRVANQSNIKQFKVCDFEKIALFLHVSQTVNRLSWSKIAQYRVCNIKIACEMNISFNHKEKSR